MILINFKKYIPGTYHNPRDLVNNVLNTDFIYLFNDIKN